MCSDVYPHLHCAEARAEQAKTDFGDYKLVAQKAVCDLWPGTPAPLDFYEEPDGDVATRFVSGELDPVTPPARAARTAGRFTHGKQLIVPGMAHIPLSQEEVGCLSAVETALSISPMSRG
jgi:pimeloyl-ACP methyl ester carboxylesterase